MNLTRKYNKLFAASGGSIGQFGSAQALAPNLSTDPEVLQALSAYDNGWNDAVISGNKRPPLEEMNGIDYVTSYQLSYLLQKGFPEWQSQTDYYIDDLSRPVADTKIYKSIVNNNIGNALTDITKWQLLGDLADLGVIPNLKTAAFEDIGTTDGTVPLISTGDKLSNSLLENATTILPGIIQISTDAEVFNKNSSKAITGLSLYNNIFFQEWQVQNSVTGLAQLVPSGIPATIGYNLLTTFLEVNESTISNIPINFKDIANSPQLKILNQTSDKFLFPSNLNTFNSQYTDYFVRINFTADITSTSNTTTKFYVRLRRVVDNSILFTVNFSQSDFGAQVNVPFSGSIPTFVNSETDPFVINGCYLDILRDSNSIGGEVTLQTISITIFRN